MTEIYKVDLHVHSNHSNKPSIWALRKFNCPESYTTPEYIYKTAVKKGMRYVTITDHNSIDGAIEIAHLPNTFISAEVTAYFPEDGCKVHIVVLDINEGIFRDVMHLRRNIYELIAYLQSKGTVHFIAHPLYDMDGNLSAETIEKLLLLFEVIEIKNGSRASRYNRLVENIVSSLTRETIEAIANKHNIQPYGRTPWIKAVVGGSDDHSGFFIARTYTASGNGAGIKDFMNSIKERRSWAAGDDGNALILAHSIYGIGYSFFKEKFESKKSGSMPFINALMNRVFNPSQGLSLFDKLNLFIRKNLPEIYNNGYEGRTFEEIMDREAKILLNDPKFLSSISTEDINRRVFSVTSYLINRLIYIYTQRLAKMHFPAGIVNLANSLSTIGLIHLLASPYYIAFYHQHRSKSLIRELERAFPSADNPEMDQKIALFTDTLHEINGVAITIKRLIDTAQKRDIELVVITSGKEETSFKNGIMSFKSIGDFSLPEYPDLKLHFPPLLDVIDYFEREEFTRIHASTPGTMGLVALFTAKLMDIPISGTYHTDIPQYVRSLTNDVFLENIAWNYMIWFYNLMEEVMVPSASTRKQLIDKGLIAEKAKPLPRWVDTEMFSPVKNDPRFYEKYRLNGGIKFIYVGRVSKEKNLEFLSDAFQEITDSGFESNLIIVGDGPYKKEMEQKLKGYPAVFTGFLSGEELCTAYASADAFVFPSTTDTFGNVVLEAQASGLPVIVSDEGGPKELMRDGITGIVAMSNNKNALINAMMSFINDGDKIIQMGRNARQFTETSGINVRDAYSTILRDIEQCTPQEIPVQA
ncbi:MAG: glycosyltransferase [Deltaproteobacteria bacterium]|nr:glycosyltransferase [Deltaproteobacteria bacterium]